MKKTDYKSAGVNIDAGNEVVDKIKDNVKSTFTDNVLTGLGSFGSLFNLGPIVNEFKEPVLVQSIDGVGTKTIIARKMKKFDTIGIDLVSACANDILVMGAKPITFLDYIANDKLKPNIVTEIVNGMVSACKKTGVSLVGGETAEMPDTYLPGEHDLVGVITGIIEKDKIITGKTIAPNDVIVGIPSNGLHTNGYSLARRIFFDIGKFSITDTVPGLKRSLGMTLLEPHINYTNHVLSVLKDNIHVKGIAHITGGGLLENIPRILPDNCGALIKKDSWPRPGVFSVMSSMGNVAEKEMFRAFNMGIGMVFVVEISEVKKIRKSLDVLSPVYEIGTVVCGEKKVIME